MQLISTCDVRKHFDWQRKAKNQKQAKQYDKLLERAQAEAEPGEEPEDVEPEFGDSAYENKLPIKYEELDTTDLNITITDQQEPLVISLTSE